MSEKRRLTLSEQVEIIQKVLADPKFFDDHQLILAGIKNKPSEKEFSFDE